ncbi:MAG: HAMP domain-containing histidine kinase [Chloroflexi bacterium]|nr:HAMP domain-containing histidine kinase [Chloroflexota bacterium]
MIAAIKRQYALPDRHSIRWRLLLSYAGIALLAAVALGSVLVFTLRSYYDQRERDYMRASANEVIPSAEQLLADDAPVEMLQASTNLYAFVALSRVRLLDADSQVLADSGAIREERVITITFRKPDANEDNAPQTQESDTAPGGSENTPNRGQGAPAPDTTDAGGIVGDAVIISGVPVDSDILPPDSPDTGFTPYLSIRGRDTLESNLNTSQITWRQYPLWSRRGAFSHLLTGDADFDSHTDLVVTVPLYDRDTNELVGYLELSEGPAFGNELVNDIAEKAVVAGAIGVLLAGIVGWFTSRRISQPVLALAETTARMADGDLTVRADVSRRDELGLLARTFNTMAERVGNTVTTLKRFVADAAHEINTPITALRTSLELAAASDSPEEYRSDLAHAQTELNRLETLTRGLLTLARIEARSDTAHHQSIDLAAVVRHMQERYASRAEQAGIVLALEVPSAAIHIQADEALLVSVLENLLDNALKFTPEDGTVTLGLCTEADSVRLWVADTGIGIPPNDVPRLFSRFYRASNAAAYPGNGLGLVISKAIVEEHGGTIAVESAAGRTCVTARLPRLTEEPA